MARMPHQDRRQLDNRRTAPAHEDDDHDDQQRVTGQVVRTKKDKGYVFVKGDHDHQDYFCHFTAFVDGTELKDLNEGDRIRFVPTMNPEKGPRVSQAQKL